MAKLGRFSALHQPKSRILKRRTFPVSVGPPPTPTPPANSLTNQRTSAYDSTNNRFISVPTNNFSSTGYITSGTNWNAFTFPQVYNRNVLSTNLFHNGFFYTFLNASGSSGPRDLYRTSDFVNWTRVLQTGLDLDWEIFVNSSTGNFMAGTSTGTVYTSSDGLNWNSNSVASDPSNFGFPKGWNGSTIVSPNFNIGDTYLWRSTNNGTSWASVADTTTWAYTDGRWIRSVAYGNGIFVALVSSNFRAISISTDNGATWPTPTTNTQLATTAQWIFFSTVKNKFLVFNNFPDGATVHHSSDAVNWSSITVGGTVARMIEAPNKVYVVGTGSAGRIDDITDLI
jgi:hypothetical protein